VATRQAVTRLVGIRESREKIALLVRPILFVRVLVDMDVRGPLALDTRSLVVRLADASPQIALADVDGNPSPLGVLLGEDVVTRLIRVEGLPEIPHVVRVVGPAVPSPGARLMVTHSITPQVWSNVSRMSCRAQFPAFWQF